MKNPYQNPFIDDPLKDRATILGPTDGEVLPIKGSTITLKVTSAMSNDQLGVYEIAMEPETIGARLHYHRFMDETFIVHEGTLTVQHGHQETEAQAGSVIYIPRFTPHGFANRSKSPVKLMLIFNPAEKREGFFHGLQRILNSEPMNPEEFLALYHRYDSYVASPENFE
jgi:quercetin dioxygenase-like cupin family protein